MAEKKGVPVSRRRVLQSAALAAGGLGLKALGLHSGRASGTAPPAVARRPRPAARA